MKRRNVIIGAAIALALGTGALTVGSGTQAQPYGGGWGTMGDHGPGWMHGRGWSGGYGPQNCPWFRDGNFFGQQGNLNLSTDDVKARFERWIAVQGNPRLKVGEIKEKGGDTITVDIVTKDNSLVEQFLVDRHTGFARPTAS